MGSQAPGHGGHLGGSRLHSWQGARGTLGRLLLGRGQPRAVPTLPHVLPQSQLPGHLPALSPAGKWRGRGQDPAQVSGRTVGP